LLADVSTQHLAPLLKVLFARAGSEWRLATARYEPRDVFSNHPQPSKITQLTMTHPEIHQQLTGVFRDRERHRGLGYDHPYQTDQGGGEVLPGEVQYQGREDAAECGRFYAPD
jgi:hypothetical protein